MHPLRLLYRHQSGGFGPQPEDGGPGCIPWPMILVSELTHFCFVDQLSWPSYLRAPTDWSLKPKLTGEKIVGHTSSQRTRSPAGTNVYFKLLLILFCATGVTGAKRSIIYHPLSICQASFFSFQLWTSSSAFLEAGIGFALRGTDSSGRLCPRCLSTKNRKRNLDWSH